MKRLFTVLFLFFMLPVISAGASTPKNFLVMGFKIDDLMSLDPAEIFEFTGAEYAANTYSRLINYNVDRVSEIYGGIAEKWEVSSDGMTYTFHIRKDVKFPSGKNLTADDVVYSLVRMVKLNLSPAFIIRQFGFTAENVDKLITKVDDYTMEFTVDKPYAPTLVLYCLTATPASIVDSKLVQSHEVNNDFGHTWLKNNYAGCGPYMLKKWKPSESLSLLANPNYYGHKPSLKRVIIKHLAESAQQRMMLEKGDIDIARNLQPEDIKAVRNNPDIDIMDHAKGNIYYMGLNQKNSYLAIPEVREAIKYLVDYKGMETTFLSGLATSHQSFIPNGFLGASGELPYSLNVKKAKELLKSVDLENGFPLTIDTRNNEPSTSMALSMQDTFAKAKIKLEIIPGDGKQTLTRYRARKHDIYLGVWGPDYMDPHTNADTFSRNPDNSDNAKSKTLAWRNSWDIPELTEKANAALMEKDSKKRVEMYMELQREHQKISPFVPMFQKIEVVGLRKNVHGFILGPTFDSNFYNETTKD